MNEMKQPVKSVKRGILKARCEVPLENFYVQLAAMRGLDTSDVVREALRVYRNQTEKKYEQASAC